MSAGQIAPQANVDHPGGGCLEPRANGREGRQATGSGVFLRKAVFRSGIVYHYSSIRVCGSHIHPGVWLPGGCVWCVCGAFSHTRFRCHQSRAGMPDPGSPRNVRHSNPLFSNPESCIRIGNPVCRSVSYPRDISQITCMYGMQHL